MNMIRGGKNCDERECVDIKTMTTQCNRKLQLELQSNNVPLPSLTLFGYSDNRWAYPADIIINC